MNYLYALAFYCVILLCPFFFRTLLFLFLPRQKQGQPFVVLLFFNFFFRITFSFFMRQRDPFVPNTKRYVNQFAFYIVGIWRICSILLQLRLFYFFFFYSFLHAVQIGWLPFSMSISSALNAILKLINGSEKKREMRGKGPTERSN